MAKSDRSAVCPRRCNPVYQQSQLFSLISILCAERQSLPGDALCRLIVDSRLPWAIAPVDGGASWWYLAEPAAVRRVANCLVLTSD